MISLLLPALLLGTAAASGAGGAWLSVAIREGGPWWLSLASAAAASGSWAWTVRAWPGDLIVASVLWNVAHDFGEYGYLSLRARPTPMQVLGIGLVMTAYSEE